MKYSLKEKEIREYTWNSLHGKREGCPKSRKVRICVIFCPYFINSYKKDTTLSALFILYARFF